MYLLTMLNVIHYRMSFFLSCMLGTLHFFVFSNINFIIRLPPLVGRGPEFFQWFQNNAPFEDSKILSTNLLPIVTIVMLIVYIML